jgi:glyoxylase-like metal-dependent hydrolase (beta-lactamase superfamily II)
MPSTGKEESVIRRACAGLALSIACMAPVAQPLPEPRVVRISERVYALLGPIQHANPDNQGYMVNSTVIVGDHGIILVDPGGSREVGLHIANAVRRIASKPVTHIVNTHHHGDHYLANSAFEGATVISSAKCRDMVRETGRDWLQLMEQMVGRSFPDTKPIAASVTYPEASRTRAMLHGIELVFWVPKGSHTVGDLLVHLPRDRVLVTGDVVVNGIVPVMQDAIIKNWIDTLREVQQLDVETIVPGHGNLTTMTQVKDLHDAIRRFYSGVKDGYDKGLDEGAIRRSLDLTDWERLERSYVIGRNINRAFLEIEFDDFNR